MSQAQGKVGGKVFQSLVETSCGNHVVRVYPFAHWYAYAKRIDGGFDGIVPVVEFGYIALDCSCVVFA